MTRPVSRIQKAEPDGRGMAAILYLILAWSCGVVLIRRLAGPDCFPGLSEPALSGPACWAAGLWVALLPLTLMTHWLAWLFASIPGQPFYPLLPANLILGSGMAAFLAVNRRTLLLALPWASLLQRRWPGVDSGAEGLAGPARPYGRHFVWIAGMVSAVVGFCLYFGTFRIHDGQLAAGYSVFSDLAPHLALTRSFAAGRNWPTEYPHFAGDGIAYHFLFYLLCGNLNALGLPVDWAINLPSLLGWSTLTILLGCLAVRITRQRLAAFLTPVLFFCRSSLALPLHVAERWRTLTAERSSGSGLLTRLTILGKELWEHAAFIGTTPRDEWGLWGVNVYLNQRHFASGLAVLSTLLLLAWPDFEPLEKKRLPARASRRPRLVLGTILLVSLPYWHGSALVAAGLILGGFVVMTRKAPVWLLALTAGFLSAMAQGRLFSGQAGLSLQPQFLWGFLAADTSLSGVTLYLLLVTGLALPVAAIGSAGLRDGQRLILGASLLLVLFTFTLSLTVDVTVNHKYLMIALLLANILIAGSLARLWRSRKALGQALAVLLAILLTATGLYEYRLVHTINRNHLAFPVDTPLVTWINESTAPDAVFLTAPYHFNRFFLTGRKVYYGHGYYAWSAGHDTARREVQIRQFLESRSLGPEWTWQAARDYGIDYLLVDDDLRHHPDWSVDEAYFAENFQVAAHFPVERWAGGQINAQVVVYDLRQLDQNRS
jgi:hypothetical protein